MTPCQRRSCGKRYVLGAAGAIAAVAIWRRSRRLGAVAAELRTPQVWMPVSLFGPRSLSAARRLVSFAPKSPLADGVTLRNEHIAVAGDDRPDVRVLIYEPSSRTRPSGALLWFHGGGLVMGTPEQVEGLCSRIAVDLGIVVVSVDYRLAPEHPFPAGLDDCYSALEWVHARSKELGIDTTLVAVGGDSSGGGLAACVAQMTVDRSGPPVCFQLLQYPMLDDRTPVRSGHDAVVWTARSNRWAWQAYLGRPATASGAAPAPEAPPYASAARRDDLAGLAPAWIGVGDIDLFHDECVEYAARLAAAGVECALHVDPGMYHGAETVMPDAPSMKAFLDRLVTALGSALDSK